VRGGDARGDGDGDGTGEGEEVVGYRWLNEQCSRRGRHNRDHNQALDV